MPIDWEKINQTYGNKENANIKTEDKQIAPLHETKAAKIIQFDQTHIPQHKAKSEYLNKMPEEVKKSIILQFPAYKLPKEYQTQALEYQEGKEAALQMAKTLQKEEDRGNYETTYRISLVKDEKEDLTAVLLKKAEEWEKDVRDGKEIPEIIITSPYQEQIGAPIPINEFLNKMEEETLAETMKDNETKMCLIDSVYDRTEDEELKFHSARVQVENNKDEYNFFSIKDNAFIPMADKYEELEAILKEANEELIDKDKYEFSDGGIVFDANMIGDANHASAIKSERIEQAGAAEQERLEWGRDTRNKGPAVLDAIRDDDVSAPPPKQMYYSELYNMEQDISKLSGEEEAMEQDVKEEWQEAKENAEEAEEQEQPKTHMSYRERIEAEDREFWEEDLVRSF